MATPEQRISYIEGQMASMATKEDLARAKEDLAREIGALEVRLTERISQLDSSIAWKLLAMVVAGMSLGTAAAAAVIRLLE